MKSSRGITLKLCLAVIVGVLAFGNASAQKAKRADADTDNTKTKQAQAVSKEVYDKIQKAQEMVDGKDYQGALRALNSLYNPDKLTEYEQANVLNYIGFVYFNMDDTPMRCAPTRRWSRYQRSNRSSGSKRCIP